MYVFSLIIMLTYKTYAYVFKENPKKPCLCRMLCEHWTICISQKPV